MNLPDFLEFKPFNDMRMKMNTEKLGHFEMFDPNIHLTGNERSSLMNVKGLQVPSSQVLRLIDYTLLFKNSRVVIHDEHCFHVCACDQIKHQEMLTLSNKSKNAVCSACLQLIHYKGYDEHKNRRQQLSESILTEFSIEQFFLEFPVYPIDRHSEVYQPLFESSSLTLGK